MSRTQRAKDLMDNLVRCLEDGLTYAQIAERYKVSMATAYRCAQQKALELGVPYETLLHYPKISQSASRTPYSFRQMAVDAEQMLEDIQSKLESISNTLSYVKEALDAYEGGVA